jgi:hypothetical protein
MRWLASGRSPTPMPLAPSCLDFERILLQGRAGKDERHLTGWVVVLTRHCDQTRRNGRPSDWSAVHDPGVAALGELGLAR